MLRKYLKLFPKQIQTFVNCLKKTQKQKKSEVKNNYQGVIHKLRYHDMGGQNPGRYNVIYGHECFKNLEKNFQNWGKMKENLKSRIFFFK